MAPSDSESRSSSPLFTHVPGSAASQNEQVAAADQAAAGASGASSGTPSEGHPSSRAASGAGETLRVAAAVVLWSALVVLLYWGAVSFDWTRLGFSRSLPPEPPPPLLSEQVAEESADDMPGQVAPQPGAP